MRSGEAHPAAKLTEAAVADIRVRHALGESLSALGRAFRVDRSTIRAVVLGWTWKRRRP